MAPRARSPSPSTLSTATQPGGRRRHTTDTYAYLAASETAWQTGQGTTTAALLDADGTRLAVKTNGTVSWLVFDLHGSVVALCPSGTSTLSDAYRFDGWGQQIVELSSRRSPIRYAPAGVPMVDSARTCGRESRRASAPVPRPL